MVRSLITRESYFASSRPTMWAERFHSGKREVPNVNMATAFVKMKWKCELHCFFLTHIVCFCFFKKSCSHCCAMSACAHIPLPFYAQTNTYRAVISWYWLTKLMTSAEHPSCFSDLENLKVTSVLTSVTWMHHDAFPFLSRHVVSWHYNACAQILQCKRVSVTFTFIQH